MLSNGQAPQALLIRIQWRNQLSVRIIALFSSACSVSGDVPSQRMIIEGRSLMSTERTACQLLVHVLRPMPDNAEPEYDVNLPNLCLSNLKAVHSRDSARERSVRSSRAILQVWAIWSRG